jgi:hypothetical protein
VLKLDQIGILSVLSETDFKVTVADSGDEKELRSKQWVISEIRS